MSRNCYECSEDGNCFNQKRGVYSCSAGKNKTREQIIDDMNSAIINLIPELEELGDKYLELNNPKKAKAIKRITGLMKCEYQKEIATREWKLISKGSSNLSENLVIMCMTPLLEQTMATPSTINCFLKNYITNNQREVCIMGMCSHWNICHDDIEPVFITLVPDKED